MYTFNYLKFSTFTLGSIQCMRKLKSNAESLIIRIQRGRISLIVLPVKVSFDEISHFSVFSKPN